MPKYILILLFSIGFGILYAQESPSTPKNIYLYYYDIEANLVTPIYKAENAFTDTSQIALAQNTFLQGYWEKGFAFASIDSIYKEVKDSSIIWHQYVFLGKAYTWDNLDLGNVPKDWLAATGFQLNKFKNNAISPFQINKISKALLDYAQNNGYPFAIVSLSNIQIKEDKIQASLNLDKGSLVKMDKIHLEKITPSNPVPNQKDQTLKLRKGYLTHYLGIRKGSAYNEKNIQKMPTRLNALPFMQVHQTPYLVFLDDKVETYFFLKSRQANRFDFLIGIQPNDNTVSPVNQAQKRNVSITGNATIDLLNAFSLGERLMFSWQRLQTQTSDLKLQFVFPYIFDLPIGVDFNFKLYRKDTAYVDIITDIGFQYLLQGGNYFKVYWKNNATNVTYIDTASVRRNRILPSNLDLRVNSVGLEYYYQQLDYRFNPRKGIEWTTNFSAGLKKIKPNMAILNLTDRDFDYGTLYDTVSNSYQIRWQNNIAYYMPLGKQATFLTKVQSAYFWSNGAIYINELYRIGGNKIQRGFDEESLYASSYVTLTLESRFLFNRNSYFFAFIDGTFLEKKSALEARYRTYPYSFGIGIALETKVGVFGLSYALGTRVGESLQFKNAKIHFGYVNTF